MSADTPEITRIDFTVVPIDKSLAIRKYAEGWTASTLPVVISASDKPLDECLAWLQERGWIIRRWPGGARAWKDEIKPVRDRGAIQRLREQFRRYPIPEVQAHTLDFAFDW